MTIYSLVGIPLHEQLRRVSKRVKGRTQSLAAAAKAALTSAPPTPAPAHQELEEVVVASQLAEADASVRRKATVPLRVKSVPFQFSPYPHDFQPILTTLMLPSFHLHTGNRKGREGGRV